MSRASVLLVFAGIIGSVTMAANPQPTLNSQPPAKTQTASGAPAAPRAMIPPREAFAACEGKREGDVVTFTTPHGETVSGPCRMIPAQLAAMPDRPPRPPEGGRPPAGNPPAGGNAGQGNNPPPRPTSR